MSFLARTKIEILLFLLIPSIAFAQPVPGAFKEATEEDLSPSCFGYQLKFSNSTVTDNGDGTCSITTSGGSSEWTDGGTFLYPADLSGAEDVITGGTTVAAADNIIYATGRATFNEQASTAGDFRVESAGDTHAIFVDANADSGDANGQVFIGTDTYPVGTGWSSANFITRKDTTTGDDTGEIGTLLYHDYASTGNVSADRNVLGSASIVRYDESNTLTSTVDGVFFIGHYAGVQIAGSPVIDGIVGSTSQPLIGGGSTISNIYAYLASPETTSGAGGAIITNVVDFVSAGTFNFGTVTNHYGFLCNDLSGTNQYCFYAGDPTAINYFVGESFEQNERIVNERNIDSSAKISTIVLDETGSGQLVFATSPTLTTPIETGKIDRNNVAVDDDDCTGEQGVYWYDTTDSAYEFCNANSGAPTGLGGGSGAPTDATYITQTANASLSNEQALETLNSGLMRVATTTGVITSITDSAGVASNISNETGSGQLVFSTGATLGATTMVGQLSMNDGVGDSPSITLLSQTGPTYGFTVEDNSDAMLLGGNAATQATLKLINTGIGELDVTVEGELYLGTIGTPTQPGTFGQVGTSNYKLVVNGGANAEGIRSTSERVLVNTDSDVANLFTSVWTSSGNITGDAIGFIANNEWTDDDNITGVGAAGVGLANASSVNHGGDGTLSEASGWVVSLEIGDTDADGSEGTITLAKGINFIIDEDTNLVATPGNMATLHLIEMLSANFNVTGGTQFGLYIQPSTLNHYLQGDVFIGSETAVSSSKVSIDGDDNQVQLAVQGNATQTSNVVLVERSDGTDIATMATTGVRINQGFAVGGLNTCDFTHTDAAGVVSCGGLNRLGGSTYSTLQSFMNFALSPGRSSGGTISSSASANAVDITAGTGFIKASDSNIDDIYFFNWPAVTLPVPSNSTRYIGVEYNGGAPRVVANTTQDWDYDTEFPLGIAVNEGGTRYIINNPWITADNTANVIERFDSEFFVERDNRVGGLILSNTGTRNVAVSAGALLSRMSEFTITAINTSTVNNFDAYYRDGAGGWTKESAATQWNNSQYDDGSGTLASLTALNYTSRWFYVQADGSLAMLYGQAQYATLAAALNDATPSTVPDRILRQGILIGRFIIQASGSTPSVTQTAFGTTFTSASVTNFSDLAGQVSDTQIADAAVDGGSGGEIADGTVDANDLATDSVSADELNATGVEAELEAALDIAGEVTSTGMASTVIGDSISVTSWNLTTPILGVATATSVEVPTATGFTLTSTSLGEGTAANDSGAFLVAAFDEFLFSNKPRVQGVLNDLDNSIPANYEFTFKPEGAVFDDAVPPGMTIQESIGTGTPRRYVADFSATVDNIIYWTFSVPSDIDSGSWTINVDWFANDTGANEDAIWAAQLSCTAQNEADSMAEDAAGTANTGSENVSTIEANQLIQTPITLSNLDGANPGKSCTLVFFRDADDSVGDADNDGLSSVARLIQIRLQIPRGIRL